MNDEGATSASLVMALRDRHMNAVRGRLPDNYIISYSSQLDGKLQALMERL